MPFLYKNAQGGALDIMALDIWTDRPIDRAMANQITWKLVDAVAADLGATEAARLKWRQKGRGVPSVWQIKIANALMADGVPVSLADFADLPLTPGRIAA